jgi:predicted negative regulator of RcsB-dependent stress response
MKTVWQIILTLVFYAWLFLSLFLLWRIWLNSVKVIQQAQSTLFAVAMKSADAAQKAAEAASFLAREKPP